MRWGCPALPRSRADPRSRREARRRRVPLPVSRTLKAGLRPATPTAPAPTGASGRTVPRPEPPGARSTRGRPRAARPAAPAAAASASASDVARVWCTSLSPLRKTRAGMSSAARVGVGEPGHVLVVAGAVGQHPALHGRDELGRVLVQEPLAVRGVPLEHLGPLGQRRHRLHALGPGRGERPPAVVRRQRQQAVRRRR